MTVDFVDQTIILHLYVICFYLYVYLVILGDVYLSAQVNK